MYPVDELNIVWGGGGRERDRERERGREHRERVWGMRAREGVHVKACMRTLT